MRQISSESTKHVQFLNLTLHLLHRLFSLIHLRLSQGIKNISKETGHIQCYLLLKLAYFVGLKMPKGSGLLPHVTHSQATFSFGALGGGFLWHCLVSLMPVSEPATRLSKRPPLPILLLQPVQFYLATH